MQKMWKSVKIWQSYREYRPKGRNFFETQCISQAWCPSAALGLATALGGEGVTEKEGPPNKICSQAAKHRATPMAVHLAMKCWKGKHSSTDLHRHNSEVHREIISCCALNASCVMQAFLTINTKYFSFFRCTHAQQHQRQELLYGITSITCNRK